MACPKVCPKFKIALKPFSFSSFETTLALISIDFFIANSIEEILSFFKLIAFLSTQQKNLLSKIIPCLITSTSPHMTSLFGRLFNEELSTITKEG